VASISIVKTVSEGEVTWTLLHIEATH